MSNKINDGGPAFPVPSVGTGDPRDGMTRGSDGMSVRTWLAGQAMSGILSQSPTGFFAKRYNLWEACWNKANEFDAETGEFTELVAALSRLFADKLIAELGETSEEPTPSHGESCDAQA